MPDISPLFAVEAEKLLSEGKTDDAIELCEKGILVYPKYPVALSILAKAYRIKGEMDAANEKLAAIDQFRPNYKAVEITKSQIDDPNFAIEIKESTPTSSDNIFVQEPETITQPLPEEPAEVIEDDNSEIDPDDIDALFADDSEDKPEETSEIIEDDNTEIDPDDIDALFASDSEESTSEIEENDSFPIDPDDIDALFESDSDTTTSEVITDTQVDNSESEDVEEVAEISNEDIDINDIAADLYDEDTPEEVELNSEISANLTDELDSLLNDLEEEKTFIEEAAEEVITQTDAQLNKSPSNFDLSSGLKEIEEQCEEIKDSTDKIEIESDKNFDLSSELDAIKEDENELDQLEADAYNKDFNLAAELGNLDHDEDIDEASETIDELENFEEYKDSEYYPEVIIEEPATEVIKEDNVDLSKLPQNAKMSALLDDSVTSIRAKDLNLISGLKSSPLQAETSIRTRDYSEQLLPASPAFPDSISVNAITSTLGNNWEARSIDIEENDIDRSGAEDNFSMLADKIKNLSMPKIDEPKTTEEEEDYAPPAVISPTIANLLAMQGRTKEAIAAYEKLIIEDPDNADVYKEKIEELG